MLKIFFPCHHALHKFVWKKILLNLQDSQVSKTDRISNLRSCSLADILKCSSSFFFFLFYFGPFSGILPVVLRQRWSAVLQCFQRLSFSLCSFFVCLSLTHTHSADCLRQPLHRLYPWGRRDSTKALMLYLLYCRRHSGSLLANDIGKQENVVKELAIKQSSNLSQFDLGKWVDMRCVKQRPGRFSDRLCDLSLYSQITTTGPLILFGATLSSRQLDPIWQATFSSGIKMTTHKDTSSQPEELSNQVAEGN